ERRAVSGGGRTDVEPRSRQTVEPNTTQDDRGQEQDLVREPDLDVTKERLEREERRSAPHVARARQRQQRNVRQRRARWVVEEEQIARAQKGRRDDEGNEREPQPRPKRRGPRPIPGAASEAGYAPHRPPALSLVGPLLRG